MEMSRVKDGNYYVVQSFMVKELKLKGLELSCYAIIYGFSQAEGQVFNGSLQYLADWTCSSKQAIMTALKKLVDKQLLIKTDKFVNGVKFVEYSATDFTSIQETCIGLSNKVEGGIQETLIPPMQESCPNNILHNKENNIENNIDNDKKDKRTSVPNNNNNLDFIIEEPNGFTNELIEGGYIEKDNIFIKDYNDFFKEMINEFGFEIVRSCLWYFIQQVKSRGYTDEFGKEISSKLAYCKASIENGARRLTRDNNEEYPQGLDWLFDK